MSDTTSILPEIDFERIRPWSGSRNGGFEELCVQLFRHTHGEPFSIVRIEGAGGDGGVEAFWELPGGDIVGLQAKYFKKLGASQIRGCHELWVRIVCTK